jgi:hypothetical protein
MRPGRSRHVRLVLAAQSLLVVGLVLSSASSVSAVQEVKNPHGPLPEGLDCSSCHTAAAWTPLKSALSFTHGKSSGFRLTGAHVVAECASCHLDLRFDEPQAAPDDCATCHADVHEGRMVEACSSCHNTRSFPDIDGLSIHARTSFPLVGAHRQITCESCHTDDVGGAYSPLDTDCASCHLDEYERAGTVDHLANDYPTDCTQCHRTVAWADAPSFDHGAVSSGFALLGAHDALRCASCHTLPGMDPIYQTSDPNDCVVCHQAIFDEEHGGTSFPTTCLSCHTVDSWDAGDFDHALTGFALLGRHARVDCSACHTSDGRTLNFPTPSQQDDCVACHQRDYDKEHAGSGFPTTCLTCHTVNDWEGGTLNHAQLSGGFDLQAPHAAFECASCHAVPGYTLLFPAPSSQDDCVSCHQSQYDAQHTGASFPTTCLSCHVRDSWSGAVVDHVAISNGFPLLGAHLSTSCAACHSVPSYALLFTPPSGPDDCVVCHQVNYQSAHAGAGYPTDCAACHTTSAWTPSSFDHDAQYFPIYSGKHDGEWSSCSTCHTSASDIGVFSCLTCHEHIQSKMDDKHKDESGYSYNSAACLSCHPRGSA